MKKESDGVLNFFRGNNLVNNPDKACLFLNSAGRGKLETIEDIGGENIKSKETEKLLGVHVSSNLDWNTHVEKLCRTLKQRLGLLRRIKQKIPANKLRIVAEAIVTSKIRYAIAVYINPRLSEEDCMNANLQRLQVIQNDMLRVIHGKKRSAHVNMTRLRKELNVFSINQLTCYHMLVETFNIVKFKSVEHLHSKMVTGESDWNDRQTRSMTRGDLKVPKRPKESCVGFSWTAPKLWNKLPTQITQIDSPQSFKVQVKRWIWDGNVPA